MRKNAYGALLVALLFVGAGCGAAVDTSADVETEGIMKEDGDTSDGDDMVDVKVDDDSVDAQVDGFLKDSDDEKEDEAEIEKDADAATSDSAEFNALMQGEYEIK